jgi:hypothetical protein
MAIELLCGTLTLTFNIFTQYTLSNTNNPSSKPKLKINGDWASHFPLKNESALYVENW